MECIRATEFKMKKRVNLHLVFLFLFNWLVISKKVQFTSKGQCYDFPMKRIFRLDTHMTVRMYYENMMISHFFPGLQILELLVTEMTIDFFPRVPVWTEIGSAEIY